MTEPDTIDRFQSRARSAGTGHRSRVLNLDVDGWKYWTMPGLLEHTGVINRARLDAADPTTAVPE